MKIYSWVTLVFVIALFWGSTTVVTQPAFSPADGVRAALSVPDSELSYKRAELASQLVALEDGEIISFEIAD